MRRTEREFLAAMLLLALAVALAFAPDAYLPMLARAFLVQWCALLAVVAALLLWRGLRWGALSSALGCALLLPQSYPPSSGGTVPENGGALRIAHLNVFQPNTRHAEVVARALASGADVLSVQEVDPAWAAALLEGLGEAYPHVRMEPRGNCYGIALFSKLPFEDARTWEVEGTSFIEAVVRTEGGPVRVIAAHTTSPISHGYFRRRNAQLDALAGNVSASVLPTVVVGDLNTVHWDRAYRRFRARSGLVPVNGPALRTWPSIGPIALIPLDHLLVPPSAGAASVERFHIPGSDHRGLLADIRFPIHASEIVSSDAPVRPWASLPGQSISQ